MKKQNISALAMILGTAAYLLPPKAFASDICSVAGSNFSSLCKLRLDSGAGSITGAIVQVILVLGIVIALFYLVLGGVRWITSGGERGKIDGARQQIIAAVVGLVIALAAFAIVNFVLYFITGQNMSGMRIPRLID